MTNARNIKILISAICLSVAFLPLSAIAATASAKITEIMYDLPGTDTSREWVEIENTGSASINLSTWKFYEAKTDHKITATGYAEVPAGAFAVIADSPDKFKADNPQYAGLLFDSAFSLSNDGEELVLHDDAGDDIDSVTYSPAWGAGGDGNSLQINAAGTWIAAVPTPGAATTATKSELVSTPSSTQSNASQPASSTISVSSETISADQQADVSSISSHSSQEVANTSTDEPSLEVSSGRNRIGFVGSPLSFVGQMKSSSGLSADSAVTYTWSFGDGTSATGKAISHTYMYPGSYVVILNGRYAASQAVSRVAVSVLDPKTTIAKATRDYIEVTNPDSFEMNIGGYVLADETGKLTVPQDTIIPAKSSLKLSYPNQKMALGTTLQMINPSGKLMSVVSIAGAGAAVDDVTVSLPDGMTQESLMQRLQALLGKI